MKIPQTSRLFLLGLALAVTTGCNVEERLWWSPDGSQAALRTPAGLCVVNSDGKVSAPIASDVIAANWLPDGKRLAVVRKTEVGKWSDIVRLVPHAEAAEAESLAKAMPELFKTLRTLTGDDEKAADQFPALLKVSRDELVAAALLCLRDTLPGLLPAALKDYKNRDKLLQDMNELKAAVFEMSVLTLAGNQQTGEPLILERTLADLDQPRPSPSAPVIAFRRGDVLVVAPLDGTASRVTVSEKVEGSHDWTGSGKSLAFAARLGEQWESSSMNLAQIQCRSIIDAKGALAAGEVTPLATIASVHPPRLRCLPDGRLLVASIELRLPAAANAHQDVRFYLIDPSKEAKAGPVALPVSPEALPMDLAHFAPSPDGKKIAIVESGSDAVAVLDVATGALEVVSPKRDHKCRTLPAWRGPGELYYAALPETGSKRAEWMRWTQVGTPQTFSRGWPDATVDGLLEEPKK